MSDAGSQSHQTGTEQTADDVRKSGANVWILVDRTTHQAAFESVGEALAGEGIDAQIVTITDVIGSVARDALAGGAERLLRGLRVAFKGRSSEEDLLGAVRRARPDVLAVTNPRYGRALGLLESITGIGTLQVGILPDYDLSADWINSSLQAFVVPTQEHHDRLVASGFLADRVLVARPAIQPGFAREVDRDAVREELGFGDEKVVLVRADGFSPHILEKMVFQATLVDTDARFIYHHNGDSAAAAALRRAADQYGLRAAMFGKVNDLERFVAASDLVLAPNAEPYVAEILAQGRPLLLLGAEERGAAQAEFLTEAGAARHVVDVLRLGSEAERILEDEALEAATAAAEELGARDGSEQVAKALTVAVDHAEEWLNAPGAPQPDTDGEPPSGEDDGVEDEGSQVRGPFETIGTGKSGGKTAAQDEAPAEQGARRERSYAGISAAEAKDQLAELILLERELERKLSECERQQERWRSRLELAREWNEEDLADEARETLRGYLEDGESIERDLNDVRRQKHKLKEAVHRGGEGNGRRALPAGDGSRERGSSIDVEKRFRKLEADRDLDDLKDKIKRDLGE